MFKNNLVLWNIMLKYDFFVFTMYTIICELKLFLFIDFSFNICLKFRWPEWASSEYEYNIGLNKVPVSRWTRRVEQLMWSHKEVWQSWYCNYRRFLFLLFINNKPAKLDSYRQLDKNKLTMALHEAVNTEFLTNISLRKSTPSRLTWI